MYIYIYIYIYFSLPDTPVCSDFPIYLREEVKSSFADRGTTSAAWSLGLDHFAVSDKESPNALPPAQGMVNRCG